LPETLFRIPNDSMEPTLKAGSMLVAERLTDSPRRNDLVTVRSSGNVLMVGRVVGLPGEEIRLADTQVLVNGKAIADHGHPLVAERARMAAYPRAGQAYVVPANSYYVIPDQWNDAVGSMDFGAAERDRIPFRVSPWADILQQEGKATTLLKAYFAPVNERLPATLSPGVQLRAVDVVDDRTIKSTYAVNRQVMDSLRGPRSDEFLRAIQETVCQSPAFKVATGLKVRYQFMPEGGAGEPLAIESDACGEGR
jgi:signal peptidase I